MAMTVSGAFIAALKPGYAETFLSKTDGSRVQKAAARVVEARDAVYTTVILTTLAHITHQRISPIPKPVWAMLGFGAVCSSHQFYHAAHCFQSAINSTQKR